MPVTPAPARAPGARPLNASQAVITRVSVAFKYGGRLKRGPLVKRMRDGLIGWWTGYEYAHCELVFHSSHGSWIACTVNEGSHVITWPNKPSYPTLSAPNHDWKLHDLPLNDDQKYRLWNFCIQERDAKRGYNRLAMWWNFAPLLRWIPINRQGRLWFCSEMILYGLQKHCGLYLGPSPHTVAPDDLYRIIASAGGQIIGGAPGALNEMSTRSMQRAAPRGGTRPLLPQ